jgi:DNA-binding response OmpR family regulator
MPQIDRVLIVEEETLLALDIEFVLAEHAPTEVTHYRSVAEARAHLSGPAGWHLALVEARLGAAEVVEFTERLAQAGVAIVVMSADRKSMELFPHAVPLEKPFDAAGLLAACDAARARVS